MLKLDVFYQDFAFTWPQAYQGHPPGDRMHAGVVAQPPAHSGSRV